MLLRLVGENAQPVDGEADIDRVGYYRYDPDGRREGEDPDKTFSEVVRDRVIDEAGGRSRLPTPQVNRGRCRRRTSGRAGDSC